MGRLVLIRHGQTEWSATGRHTSHTDLDLTEDGERQARALAGKVADWKFTAVVSSPRLRALRTAELAGLTVTAIDDDLAEWDYGQYEGVTTPEIRRHQPNWSLWTDGAPGGESPDHVARRIDRLLGRLSGAVGPATVDGDVALLGHGHALRVLAARWLGLPVVDGALFKLDSGTLSVLGHEQDQRVIEEWNVH
jgi:broad specificity phosphatase PhoE